MDLLHLTVTGVVALLLSLVLNRVMMALAPRLGLVDRPGERRIHVGLIPRAGGLAIWLAFMLTMAVVIVWLGGAYKGPHLTWNWYGAFAAGSFVLLAAGILDDRFGLRPLVKLGAHFAAPTLMFLLFPMRVGLFPESAWIGWDLLVFMVWSVVLINAFNLIDGLDGLCGGLATVACFALAGLAVVNSRNDTALILGVMAMCLAGFLWYNMNPARIFLGDAGSMLMGFFLATAATSGLGRRTVLGVVLLPIAIAGVPMMDVLLAIWRRWMKRWMGILQGNVTKSGLFEADREHLHHRMLDVHGSQRRVAVTLQIVAVVVAALCLLPLLFGDQMLRFSLVGALILGLAVMRHFARVEIENTGEVLHLAIKMPGHRRKLAALLFCYDAVVLIATGLGAILMETNLFVRDTGWDFESVAFFLVVFVTSGLLALFGAKVHQRMWVRATLRDLLAVAFWLMVCGAVTFSLVSLVKASIEWSVLRTTLIACLGAGIWLCLPRLALDTVREIALVHRVSHKNTPGVDSESVVVIGAGDMGTLFLEHLKASSRESYEGLVILGFVDENEALHGRLLRSFKVLGGRSVLRKMAENGEVKGVVVAVNNPQNDLIEFLDELAANFGLKVYWWNVSLTRESGDARHKTQDGKTQEGRPETEERFAQSRKTRDQNSDS